MKKYPFFLFVLVLTTKSLAQDQISIKLSPGLAYSRVYTNPDTANFTSDAVTLGGKLGAVYDWFIKENYYLSTGIFLVAKQVSIKNKIRDNEYKKEQHEIQYLQVPLLLKLYTSEITLDTRLYFELGFTGALRINDRITKLIGEPIANLRRWEVGGMIGGGIEYNLSLFTSIFTGISYQLGLSSMLSQKKNNNIASKLFGYADLVTLDIGIKF